MGETNDYLEANVEELGREAAGFDEVRHEILVPSRVKVVDVGEDMLALAQRIIDEVEWDKEDDKPTLREILSDAVREGLFALRNSYEIGVKSDAK